jgi:hypothetical protein
MKRSIKITGILLALSIVCSITISAQGRGRGPGNYSHMQGYGREFGFRHSNDSLKLNDSVAFRGMRPDRNFGDGPWNMPRGGRAFMPGPAQGNMKGMGPMHQGMPGMGFGPQGRGGFNPPAGRQTPGLGRLDNLPGITDKQKKEIIDLRYKQMAEIEKFRVDNQSKMKVMREEHRKKMLELLTEDQKKLLEAGPQKPNANAPK